MAQIDLETFLVLAEQNRRAKRARVANRPIGELYQELANGTSPMKFSAIGNEVFVSIDGLARSLRSY